ncbi:MAG: DUF4446 family protein [Lachnospiraceae bacterium]|nr:DUF4446 family protein [Lachnospiraceae bacterium]
MFSFKDIGLETDLIVVISLGIIFLLVILSIVLLAKVSNLKRRYESFMKDADGKSLESAFQKKFANIEYINDKLKEVDTRLNGIDTNLLQTYQKIGIVKYDAFKEIGGTLSFVLTLLTKDDDGFILNSMHSNTEGCYTYIKEVKAGEVFVSLSEEESQSLEEAKNCR